MSKPRKPKPWERPAPAPAPTPAPAPAAPAPTPADPTPAPADDVLTLRNKPALGGPPAPALPVASLGAITPDPASEGAALSALVTLSAPAPAGGASGTYAWDGNPAAPTPADAADFTGTRTGQWTIPAGQTQTTVSVGTSDDALAEGAEGVRCTIAVTAGCTLGVPSARTGQLAASDQPTTPPPTTPAPSGTTALRFNRAAGDQGVATLPALAASPLRVVDYLVDPEVWHAQYRAGVSGGLDALGQLGTKADGMTVDGYASYDGPTDTYRVPFYQNDTLGGSARPTLAVVPRAAMPPKGTPVRVRVVIGNGACRVEVRRVDTGALLGTAGSVTGLAALPTSAGAGSVRVGRTDANPNALAPRYGYGAVCVGTAEWAVGPDGLPASGAAGVLAVWPATTPGTGPVPNAVSGGPALALTGGRVYDVSEDAVPAAWDVAPSEAVIAVGEVGTFAAAPRNSWGDPLTGLNPTWASSNPAVLSLSGSGTVVTGRALMIGSATVTASYNGTVIKTIPVTVASASEFDGFARTPGPRMTSFKLWATKGTRTGVMDQARAVPAARRFTPASNTQAAFDAAMNAACASTGGDAAVVLPEGYKARVYYEFRNNVDTTRDIFVVSQYSLDHPAEFEVGLRAPMVVRANQPRLEVSDDPNYNPPYYGGREIFYLPNQPGARNLKVVDVDLRGARFDPGDPGENDRYTFCLVRFGQYGVDQTTQPRNLMLYMCQVGGLRFDSAGNWRRGNIGRVVFDNGAGCAIVGCYDSAHGSVGNQGSDRGIWGGVYATGPVWLCNNGGDSFGGIAFMLGGDDATGATLLCEDMEAEYNDFNRADAYYGGTAGAVRDASGNTCPWAFKNLTEVKKRALRHRYRRNWIHNFRNVGQPAACTLKSMSQDGGGDAVGAYDLAFVENIVEAAAGECLAISSGEGYNGGAVEGIQRMTVARNYFSSPGNCIRSGTHAGSVAQPKPAADWWISDNAFADPVGFDGGKDTSFYCSSTYPITGRGVVWRGNVTMRHPEYVRNASVAGTEYDSYGYNVMFVRSLGIPDPATQVVCEKNIIARGFNEGPVDDGPYAAAQFYYPSVAALGLQRNAAGLWQPTANTVLTSDRTKLDLPFLGALRDAVAAGDVRAYLA